jgi:hypothetical protein
LASPVAEYASHIVVSMASIIVTGVGAYIVCGQKLAEIKGQLSQILKLESKVDDSAKAVAEHDRRLTKHDFDLKAAHDKIKVLEKSVPPRSLHPKT